MLECMLPEVASRGRPHAKPLQQCNLVAGSICGGGNKLYGTCPTVDEQVDLQTVLRQARDAGSDAKLCIAEKHVRQILSGLRIGAQPGGSKCRNDVLCKNSARLTVEYNA